MEVRYVYIFVHMHDHICIHTGRETEAQNKEPQEAQKSRNLGSGISPIFRPMCDRVVNERRPCLG